jgi:hypothetical protein
VLGENGARLAAEAVAGGSPFNVAIGLSARLSSAIAPASLTVWPLLTDLLMKENVNRRRQTPR